MRSGLSLARQPHHRTSRHTASHRWRRTDSPSSAPTGARRSALPRGSVRVAQAASAPRPCTAHGQQGLTGRLPPFALAQAPLRQSRQATACLGLSVPAGFGRWRGCGRGCWDRRGSGKNGTPAPVSVVSQERWPQSEPLAQLPLLVKLLENFPSPDRWRLRLSTPPACIPSSPSRLYLLPVSAASATSRGSSRHRGLDTARIPAAQPCYPSACLHPQRDDRRHQQT